MKKYTILLFFIVNFALISNKGKVELSIGIEVRADSFGDEYDGYDSDGYDADGYDRDGYDKDGYDSDGYDADGYDRDGYDKDGYDKDGYDKDGYDKDGKDRPEDYKYDQDACTQGSVDWDPYYCSSLCDEGSGNYNEIGCEASNCIDGSPNSDDEECNASSCSQWSPNWDSDYCSSLCDEGSGNYDEDSCERSNCIDGSPNSDDAECNASSCSQWSPNWDSDYCSSLCDEGSDNYDDYSCEVSNCIDGSPNYSDVECNKSSCSQWSPNWDSDYCSSLCEDSSNNYDEISCDISTCDPQTVNYSQQECDCLIASGIANALGGSNYQTLLNYQTSSSVEWGYETLYHFNNDNYSQKEVREGESSHFLPDYTTTDPNSVVINVSHDHPNGTPLSPTDIVQGAGQIGNDLRNSNFTDDQKAFILENFSMTAIGDYTYSVHYNNPFAVWDVSVLYASFSYWNQGTEYTGIEGKFYELTYAQNYSHAAALLALFGNSISLMKSPNNNPPGNPNTVIPNSTGKNTTERTTNCNQP